MESSDVIERARPPHQVSVQIPEPYTGMPIAFNPPTFRWPEPTRLPVSLEVRSTNGEVVLEATDIQRYYYRPLSPLPSGEFEWAFTDAEGHRVEGDVFEIEEMLPQWPVISGQAAVKRVPLEHPRVHIRPENLVHWKSVLKDEGQAELSEYLRKHGNAYNTPRPELPESVDPNSVSDKGVSGSKQTFWNASDYALKAARGVVESCLLYQATEDPKYADYVKDRALMLADLDPHGLTSHDVNDFSNSRIVNALGWAYSWVYDTLSEDERQIIRGAILERCRIALVTAEAERWPWPYIPRLEYTKVEPHAWQFVNYHLLIGLIAIHGESDEADAWLAWLIDLYVANFPWFGGADGASAEQVPYFLGTNFVSSQQAVHLIQTATGIDLTGNPWHKNAPYFLMYGFGIGSNSSQFGDNGGRPAGPLGVTTIRNAAVQFQDGYLASYYERLRENSWERGSHLPLLGVPFDLPERKQLSDLPQSRLFEDVGLVFMRSDIENPDEEIFFEFKSSPFGSTGHGHNDQNSMNLSAYGQRLLLDSGFYNYYNSPHHYEWTQSTQAHNTILMNGTGQPHDSPEHWGEIVHFEEDATSTYVIGDAHRAYNQVELTRFDRHVLWLKPDIFVVADDIVSAAPIEHQFLLHAVNAFEIDGDHVLVENEPAEAEIIFLEPQGMRIWQHDNFLRPIEEMGKRPGKATPVKQWHLIASPEGATTQRRFLTVIKVSKTGMPNAVEVNTTSDADGWTIETSDGREGRIEFR